MILVEPPNSNTASSTTRITIETGSRLWAAPELEIESPAGPRKVRFPDEGAECIVGSSRRHTGLVVADAFVSRRHARFFTRQGRSMVQDLGSKHGTWLNGRRISEPVVLHDGDALRLGQTTVLYRCYLDMLLGRPEQEPTTSHAAPTENADAQMEDCTSSPAQVQATSPIGLTGSGSSTSTASNPLPRRLPRCVARLRAGFASLAAASKRLLLRRWALLTGAAVATGVAATVFYTLVRAGLLWRGSPS